MKKLIVVLFVLSTAFVFGQSGLGKVTSALNYKLKSIPQGEDVLVWAFFTDKGNSGEQLMKSASSLVSEKSIERRRKNIQNAALVDETDLPVNSFYIEKLASIGFKIKQSSKWLNGVSGYVKKENLLNISSLSFVKSVDIVNTFKKVNPVDKLTSESSTSKVSKPLETNALDYGASLNQNQIMNVPAVHNMGINGTGVMVGVFDAGFNNLAHEVFSTIKIVAQYDFVNKRTYVGDGNGGLGVGDHGTWVLSCLGGYKPGKLIGPAYGAKFVLAKTENTASETPAEEDNWIRAIEWADSIGIDVATTSLGYLTYDSPYTSYTWQNMDGKTARITLAADLAFKKGIVVLNSAGNENYNADHNTLNAPADGFNVITVGAVNSSGIRSSFSSVGNTVDGRIKPDIMAMGEGVTVASTTDITGYTRLNGTSFSCPLSAGVAALLLSAKPQATNVQIRDALRNTASNSTSPNREYGWGIINALSALNSTALPVELAAFKAETKGDVATLSWSTSSENNNLGFEIERGMITGTDNQNIAWISVGFIKGAGTTTEQKQYTFSEKLQSPGKYCYRLKQKDFDGKVSISSIVYVDYPAPNSMVLFQNYPNPFNPSTNVSISIPAKSTVKLTAVDVLGKESAVIYYGDLEKGIYTFRFDGSGFASGTYFLRLSDGRNIYTKKCCCLNSIFTKSFY